MATWKYILIGIMLMLSGCGASAGPTPAAAPPGVTPTAPEALVGAAVAEPSVALEATPVASVVPTATAVPEPVRFAIIGDFGLAGPMAAEVASLVQSWSPDFIVTTGDNNYPNGATETIDANVGQYYHAFISPYQGDFGEGAETNRFFPILGNHDLDIAAGQAYLDYFTLPGNERYYHVEWEPVGIFALNSMPGEPDGITADSAQAEWLRQELAASSACWKLVFFHHPAYSSGHRGASDWMRWPYREWGADAAFSGHNHLYERVMQDGWPYFTNGLGGGPRYAFAEQITPGSEARYNADHGAMLVEATPDRITYQFVTRTGDIIDTYTLEQACR